MPRNIPTLYNQIIPTRDIICQNQISVDVILA